MFVDRTENEVCCMFLKRFVGCHPVDFGGGWENNALIVFVAPTDNLQIGFEIQLEDTERLCDVKFRCCDGNQREDDVALFYEIMNIFMMNEQIAFVKMKPRMIKARRQFLCCQINRIHFI